MDQYIRSIISGERVGAFSAMVRAVFTLLSWIYTLIVNTRNELYDRGVFKATKLPVPVISVGNITTGGTGKTPTVIMIVKELQKLGKKPAVLTRGYKAPKGGQADEVLVIEKECPGVPVIVNPNRIAGGREAIAKHGADVLILDDGFQHRRLHRDLNIVLVDATAPLGIPGVVPRGTWREPPYNLRRANVIMLTRCEQVDPALSNFAGGLLTQWVVPRDIYQQRTVITGVYDAAGNPVEVVPGTRVIAFAGIGNPQGFLHTVRSLGLAVSAACWFDDHHNYDVAADFAALARLSAQRDVAAWVTTLKDAVKLNAIKSPVPLWHVRIATHLDSRAAEVWRKRLAAVVGNMTR